MLKLTWDRALAWRLRRQHLDVRLPAGRVLDVASRLCGLHAQVMSSAELTAWARVEDLDRKAVQRALWEDRTLVKTWAMRGTLHLLRAGELPLWHAALATSRRYSKPDLWLKYFGLSMDDLERFTQAVASALDGRVLTREELMREVGRITRSPAFAKLEGSWGTVLKPAAFSGLLCFGPSVGQRVRFTRPDTWLSAGKRPSMPKLDPEQAVAAVTRRFLDAYAPATHHDLARWWGGGSSVTTARRWIAALGDEVTQVDLEGAPALVLTEHLRELRDTAPCRCARLLPGFDQYVVAASYHAERLLPGNLRHRIYRPQGWISPVLLVNGRMLGTWRHEINGSRLKVAIESFVPAPGWVRRAAAGEAERLAAFFGTDLQLEWTS